MGKYLGVIIGSVVTLLGLKGLIYWWPDFIIVLKGSIPVMLILGGVIAAIAGFSEIKDENSSKREDKR